MNILILTGDLSLIGGIEKYNKDLINSFKNCNCNIYLIQRYKGGILEKISFLFRTVIYIFFNKPRYIMCCHINFSPILLFLNYIMKIKYCVSIYGIEAIGKFSKLKKIALEKADKILTISEYTKELIVKQNISFKKKIIIIKSCVNENLFNDNKFKINKEKYNVGNRKVVMTLSRLSASEEKGHNRVLKSLEILNDKFPNFVYMIVGGGSDKRVSEILCENEDLKKKVIFTGPIKDEEKNSYLSLADVFILPSKNEGFAIVFLEALMAGLVVIAPNKYGCPEGLLHGELGILVDEDRKDLIADAILSVFLNKIPFNLKNRKMIISKTKKIYGIERWNKEVKEFYESIKINRV